MAPAWGIDSPPIANETIEKGQLEVVTVGKAHLANPNWSYQAALALKKEKASWLLPALYALAGSLSRKRIKGF